MRRKGRSRGGRRRGGVGEEEEGWEKRRGGRRGGVGEEEGEEEEGWEKGEEYLLFAVRYTRRTTTSHTISKVCDLRGEGGEREERGGGRQLYCENSSTMASSYTLVPWEVCHWVAHLKKKNSDITINLLPYMECTVLDGQCYANNRPIRIKQLYCQGN